MGGLRSACMTAAAPLRCPALTEYERNMKVGSLAGFLKRLLMKWPKPRRPQTVVGIKRRLLHVSDISMACRQVT